MRQYFEYENKVARRAARNRGFAVTFLLHITARIRARGNVDSYRGGLTGVTFAGASRAFFYYLLTRTAARVACAGGNGTEYAVARRVLNTARAVALFAGFVRRAVFRARSATILAGFFTGISNFLGATFRRVEEGKFDFDGNIRARSVLGFFSAAARKLT